MSTDSRVSVIKRGIKPPCSLLHLVVASSSSWMGVSSIEKNKRDGVVKKKLCMGGGYKRKKHGVWGFEKVMKIIGGGGGGLDEKKSLWGGGVR